MCDTRVDFEGQMIHNFLFQKDSSIFIYIRSCSGKPKLPSVMPWGSCAANTSSQIANLFNQYFHSVYSDSTLPVQPPPSIPEHSICSIEISQHDTFLSICSLNGDKAMGGDDIPPVIINGAATAILEPVYYLLELCLKKASLPLEWRDHYITPSHHKLQAYFSAFLCLQTLREAGV